MSYVPKILIVDDEPRMCDSLDILLSGEGYEIHISNCGKDAIERLAKDSVDLVLLDIVMPDMDGRQVMHYINSQDLETLVIVMTGHASTESAVDALRGGAYDYLKKPFEHEELLRTVENALQQKRLRTERKQAEQALQKARDELETRVKQRTADFARANKELKEEIRQRKQVEDTLRENAHRLQIAYDQAIVYAQVLNEEIAQRKQAEEALREQTHSLEEVNAALKVVIRHREEDKAQLEETVLSNVKETILPYVSALKKSRLGDKEMAYVNIIESHLNDIVSPFLQKLSSKYFDLTPREVEVAILIKEGKITKEIAELLNVSNRAVEFHRENLRAKLNLKHKKANLRSYLLSLA